MKAAELGESSYDGAPCKTCGSTKRHTINASCIQCSNERTRVNVAAQRVKIKALLEQAKAAA